MQYLTRYSWQRARCNRWLHGYVMLLSSIAEQSFRKLSQLQCTSVMDETFKLKGNGLNTWLKIYNKIINLSYLNDTD